MKISNSNNVGHREQLKLIRGFTLMELMITIAIIAILATITMPSLLVSRQRSEVAEVVNKADIIREDITDYYNKYYSFPSDNKKAGIPEPELMIGNKFTRMEIEDGAIHITFGNKVSKPLKGKILTLRPAIVAGSPHSPISWLCGAEEPVTGMEAIGINKTDLDNSIVPGSCDN